MSRTEILTRDRSRRSHQTHRCPGHEREELRVRNRIDGHRRGALGKRTDKGEQQYAPDIHRYALNPGGQTKLEKALYDVPIRSVRSAARKLYDPSSVPEP